MCTYVIAYDVGSTALKTCLFEISREIKLIESAIEGYSLNILKNGGIEQNPHDWWSAMCITTKKILNDSKIRKNEIKGISFCAQMQGLVLVDENGDEIRPAMSYMDNRASKEHEEGLSTGIKVSGLNINKAVKSLFITGAVAASIKDPLWKYKWVEKNEPNNFSKLYKWLDVKEYLICKTTGEFVMTEDSAFATMLYDIRDNKRGFSKDICRMFGVNTNHLPKVVKSTDIVGKIHSKASEELGLEKGTLVFGGGGDASLIGVGAGSVKENDTHIYLGTSGWVSTVVSKHTFDIKHMITAIVGANDKYYNYFAELETAGKCLEWVKDHLALDDIGVYLEKKHIHESQEEIYKSLYDYMMYVIKDIPPGSNGVIFTPWLHGNRCPFEDHNSRGVFFNISIDTGKTELIHSVLEGICYHLRWQLETIELKVKTSNVIRLVGGGALAPLTCQILSDILGRKIETVEDPQNIGAKGAAVIMAVGLNIIDKIEDAQNLIKTTNTYVPDMKNKYIYDKYFEVFKSLYENNKKSFALLNNN